MKKLHNLLAGIFLFFSIAAGDPPNVVFILADNQDIR
jgi:hypothetical protein